MRSHDDVEQVSAGRLAELLTNGDVTLVDVREHEEWNAGHIKGAVHVPLTGLTTTNVPNDKPLVFMCHIGGRSQVAAEMLKNAGTEASNLSGGILAWVGAGLPITTGD